MSDIFDHPILCNNCRKEMKPASIIREGFLLRAMICQNCKENIIHPIDEAKFNKYKNLRSKQYFVKMRLVGNSYAVSIPKEIVAFMQQQEQIMDDMVKLCFEDFGRVSLKFNESHEQNRELDHELTE